MQYNWAEICSELKLLEKRADEKIKVLASVQGGTFPIDRLKKGKEIIAISKSIRLLMDHDLERDAETLIRMLLAQGVKLKCIR